MMRANHQVNIVKIDTILPHGNADNLEIIKVGEYQVVSRKGQFKAGDLGVYLQPDSVVPQTEPFRFIWGEYFDASPDKQIDENGKFGYEVPEKKRRITVRRFRGEWSEGLLLPITDFDELVDSTLTRHFVESDHPVGKDVSELLGITHYDPDKEANTGGDKQAAPKRKRRYPKTIRGWINFLLAKLRFWKKERYEKETDSLGIPSYDVNALKNYPNTFQDGELVSVTEKIHGSNARYVFIDGVMYAGSKNYWKAQDSNCVWRKAITANPWVRQWCESHPEYVLYGEVGATQKGFDYGHSANDPFFFVFDVRLPNGKWADESTPEGLKILIELQPYWVPELYKGPYDKEAVKALSTGPSTVMKAKHIREGVVVSAVTRRAKMKVVSNTFLEKDK